MTQAIDMDTLREVLAGVESMVEHYSGGAEKRRQNAALIAAGCGPIHTDFSVRWDTEQYDKNLRHAEVLKAVIAHFEHREAAMVQIAGELADEMVVEVAA